MAGEEEWRPIDGWPYEVSSLGRVRRTTPGRNTFVGRIAGGSPDQDGYLRATLNDRGRVRIIRIHKLVCATFCGPRPSKAHQAAHKDGTKINNAASNLYWATPKQNSADAVAHGVQVHGVKHPLAKLSPERVAALRRTYDAGGISFEGLAKQFGVSVRCAWLAYKGRTWARTIQTPSSSLAQ